MAGSLFGKNFTIQTFGESHGAGIGVIVDGVPSNLPLSEEDIQIYLDRRKPGNSRYATKRAESDTVEILSGIFEGKTTGTPIAMLVRNTSQRSGDYSEIASFYRPGHADFTFDAKYGFRDYRGGGRSSGRETIGRVAGGAVALKILKELGINVMAYTKSIGPVSISYDHFDAENILTTPTAMPDETASKEAEAFLQKCMAETDSAGGVIECCISGLPAGIGEPVFDKIDARLSAAVMSIGAVKAFEIGDGILSASCKGSENNDSFQFKDGKIEKLTNHSGGTLGGISDGSPLVLRAYVKPTPSIFKTQQTVNKNHENIEINIKGRHDPIIVPRAVVVVEAMAGLTVLDLLMDQTHARMENLHRIFN